MRPSSLCRVSRPCKRLRLRLEALEARVLLDAALPSPAVELFGLSPALFVENAGQWADETVRFVHDGAGASVALADSGPIFQLYRSDDSEGAVATEALRFSASFVGAEGVVPTGLDRAETVFNYLIGDPAGHREGVPSYAAVAYEGLYEGIDLHTWGLRSSLKYEFRVAPGADWSQIAVRYEGIAGLALGADGSLEVDLGAGWGALEDAAPYIYQDIGGERVEVAGRFVLVDERTYAFAVDGDYDPALALVIDPDLAWSTYLGGGDYDAVQDLALDGSGNLYAVGLAYSSGWASGGGDTTFNGECDAFVAKLTPTGAHVWSTYLGGSDVDYVAGVVVDASGRICLSGVTSSAGWVDGGFDTTYNGGSYDTFAAVLTNAGGHVWSTYLGGSAYDRSMAIGADDAGNLFVGGYTDSPGWVSGGLDSTWNGGTYDAYLVKLSPEGAHEWSTYLGGTESERIFGLTVDGSGTVHATGDTASADWEGFPLNGAPAGNHDVFVAVLTGAGAPVWGTRLGGSDWDQGYDVTADAAGNVYVAGMTYSAGWTSGGFDTSYGGGSYDAFVARLSPTGEHEWSTYLGSTGTESVRGIAVDPAGLVLVAGVTDWPDWTSWFGDTTSNGAKDAFLALLTPSGAHIASTAIGGAGDEQANAVLIDDSGRIYMAGFSESPGWTSDGFDTTYGGGTDGFVAALPSPCVVVPFGDGAARTVTFTDADGTTARAQLSGGQGVLYFTGTDIEALPQGRNTVVTGTDLEVYHIDMAGTSGRTSLTLTARGGDGVVRIENLAAGGDLRQINARGALLQGALRVGGTAGRIALAGAQGAQSTIGIGAPATDRQSVVLQFGSVLDLTLDSATPIRSLTATEWLDTGGLADTLTAPSIGSLKVRGSRRDGIAGDFCATVNTAQGLAKVQVAGDLHAVLNVGADLRGLSVRGTIDGTALNVAGDLRVLAVRGDMLDSTVDASRLGRITVGGVISGPSAEGDYIQADEGYYSVTERGTGVRVIIGDHPRGVPTHDFEGVEARMA